MRQGQVTNTVAVVTLYVLCFVYLDTRDRGYVTSECIFLMKVEKEKSQLLYSLRPLCLPDLHRLQTHTLSY